MDNTVLPTGCVTCVPATPAGVGSDTAFTIFPTTKEHTHTAIVLHDIGSHGEALAANFRESKISSDRTLMEFLPSWKWVFPSAYLRERDDTIQEWREWFDLRSCASPNGGPYQGQQVLGLDMSIKFIQGVIEKESKKVGSKQIVLVGMGQGCATAVLALLVSQWELGAFIGLSGWLPFAEEIIDARRNGATPGIRFANLARMFRMVTGVEKPPALENVENYDKRSEEQSDVEQSVHGLASPALSSQGEQATATASALLQPSHLGPSSQEEQDDATASALLNTPIFVGHAQGHVILDVDRGAFLQQTLGYLGFKAISREFEAGADSTVLSTRYADAICGFINLEVMKKFQQRCVLWGCESKNVRESPGII